jgi:uncharacterized protein
MTTGSKRLFFLAAGWLFVGLAVLGVFVPVLPTTPFLLLASSCFLRSSDRARRWLLASRWFGPTLRDWDQRRAVRRPVKLLAVAVIVAAIAVTLAKRDLPLPARVAVVALGAVGLLVLWCLPTVPGSKGEDAIS